MSDSEDFLIRMKAHLVAAGGKMLVVGPPAFDRLGKLRTMMDALAAGEIKVRVDKSLARDVYLWTEPPERFPPMHMPMLRCEVSPIELPPMYRFNAMELLKPPRFIGVDWGIDDTPKLRRPRRRVRPCPARKRRMAQAKLDRQSNVRRRKRQAELKRRSDRS